MRTLLVILGIWLLLNILFVVVVIPPRKPRPSRADGRSAGLSPVPVRHDAATPGEDPPVSLRHVIIAIALGAFFSLSPPLLEAYDMLRSRLRRLRGQSNDESSTEQETLQSILAKLRAEYDERSSSGLSDKDDGDRR
ncbi:hypothetical protein ABIE85_008869 [Bradyrhizobium diazoefficiens]|jgi:hypothetical protein|uniref:hypothetical protein n=1 Tax=Bradyrhizobium TaxID=374 RepID=UPI0027299AAC|nr:hypothetical protein [Bradyrhizobium diazoefficiens]WLA59007.1 hypothetical protein QIH81_10165 [Bradyrhizobium diazoefficiens]